jgi:SRSO17 transposase
MTPTQLKKLTHELEAYVEFLTADMGRPERRHAMGKYIHGLLLDGQRKSIFPMAERMADDADEVQGLRQRLQRCVKSSWEDEELYRRIATKLYRELPGIEAFVLDDTGFAKKGRHSVGVARQYSGTLGRTDNCQVAVSLHLAGERGSGCIGMRLYLPERWTDDRERCDAAGVPDDVGYAPKWQLGLALIDQALGWGVHPSVALADSGYGDTTEFRDGLVARGLIYSVAVRGTAIVWRPGVVPKPPEQPRARGPGRPRTRLAAGNESPVAIATFAQSLGRSAYRKVTWRAGSRGKLASYFAAVRVRTAHRHAQGAPPGEEQWLLCEWPLEEKAPTKFYLSTQPTNCSLKELVRTAHLRWRVERDYQDMKQEVGLDNYEGRTWRGFHHHAALCAAAHAFLALRRALFPPEEGAVHVAARAPPSPAGAHRQASGVPTLQAEVQSQRTATWAVAPLKTAAKNAIK